MLKQSLTQRSEQILSARQLMQIKLLELPIQEMSDRIRQEIEENPALEEGKDEEVFEGNEENRDDHHDENENADLELGDYATFDDIPAYKLRVMNEREERRQEMPFAASAPSFSSWLLSQLELMPLTSEEQHLAPLIVNSLSDDGYLRRTPEELADDYAFSTGRDVSPEAIRRLVEVVKELDPAGVGASDLRECLLLQLKRYPQSPERDNAKVILQRRFEDFANKRFDKIERDLKLTTSELGDAMRLILKLNPKPGNSTIESFEAPVQQIRPDFSVDEEDGIFTVSLLGMRDLPPLRISQGYQQMVEQYRKNPRKLTTKEREAFTFTMDKIERARWFIDAIHQRQRTLLDTMRAIVELQKAYFTTGELSDLKPMILKDVADLVGVDISTISRVASGKYVETDFGIFSLKHFFSPSLTNEEGQEVSNKEVERLLTDIITAEDKGTPLTDEELQMELEKEGFKMARRTVSKYRKRLGFATARLRRELPI